MYSYFRYRIYNTLFCTGWSE